MKTHPARWGLLLLACLLVAACQDRRGPVKPSVSLADPPAGFTQTLA
jgi:hypothetical protein